MRFGAVSCLSMRSFSFSLREAVGGLSSFSDLISCFSSTAVKLAVSVALAFEEES